VHRNSTTDPVQIHSKKTKVVTDSFFKQILAPCELPRIHHGGYSGGYRAGLTIANGSVVDYYCQDPDYAKANPRPVRCQLGELMPEYPACKSHKERGFGYDGDSSSLSSLAFVDVENGRPVRFVANRGLLRMSSLGEPSSSPHNRSTVSLIIMEISNRWMTLMIWSRIEKERGRFD